MKNMKRFPAKILICRSITLSWLTVFLVAATVLTAAAPSREAHVSQVVEDVKLLEAHGAPRPAAVNDTVTAERAVRTGKESRAELTFTDLTVTRLGANTIFSLKAGAREVDLKNGTILLSVPTGAAPVRANTVAVTVAVTGGTALLGTGPPTKFMVLEGLGTLYPKGHPEQAVTVHAGEMVTTTKNGRVRNQEKVDVKLVLETSLLIVGFPPLPNLPLIMDVVDQQLAEQSITVSNQLSSKSFLNVIDVTDQNADANPDVVQVRVETPGPSPSTSPTTSPTISPTVSPTVSPSVSPTVSPSVSPTVSPSPSPIKFGTPATITSPNPYLITSGTVISTDPSITTNGVTDFGKIYRGPDDDGPFSLWAFGSTSAFDNALHIDTEFFDDPNHLPIAVFKFQRLSLTGNPTIDTTDGVTKLGLIGVDGITSGPPGGTLTFTGLDMLAMATVNGSINLTSDVAFQGLNELAIYARGAASNLILNSPISNIGVLYLAAENSIHLTNPDTMTVGGFEATAGNSLTLQIGGSLLLDGGVDLNTMILPGTTLTSGGDVSINISGNYANNSADESSHLRVRNEDAHIGTGGNIAVTIGGNLTAMSDFDLAVQNTSGQIDNGGNITLATNGSISTGGEFNLLVENSDESDNPAGQIGTGGNILVTTNGDLSADSFFAVVDNSNGGIIGTGGNIFLNISGNVTCASNFDALISNEDGRIDNGGNIVVQIGGSLSAGDVFFGGDFVSMEPQGPGENITLGVENALTIHNDSDSGGLDMEIITPVGQTLTSGANLTLAVGGNLTTDSGGGMFLFINNNINTINNGANISVMIGGNVNTGELTLQLTNAGGTIGTGGNVTLDVGGDVTSAGETFLELLNSSGSSGGTIGSDVSVSLSANNVSASNNFFQFVDNTAGGRIGGRCSVDFNLGGGLTSGAEALFGIFNAKGTIVSDATITVHASNVTANSLTAQIDNTGGNIGGNARINMNVSGTATVATDAMVAIFGSDAAGSSAINVNGGNYSVGGTFLSFIDGNGTMTFNNAIAHADVLKAGVFGANGVLNIGGGMLSADSTLKLYAPGSNGQLNFVSNVTLGGNSLKILAANSVTIFDNVVVTIGGPNPVDVYTNHPNYSGFGGNGTTTGTFAGAGAHNPQPLSSAPPFGPSLHPQGRPSGAGITKTAMSPPHPRPATPAAGSNTRSAINIRNTDELLSMLDKAGVTPNGRLAVPHTKSVANSKNVPRMNTNRVLRADPRLMIQQTRNQDVTRVGAGKRIM